MHEPALREAQLEYDAAWRAAIAQILGELTDDVEPLTQRVVALMDGLSVALLTGGTTLTVEQAWEHVKALLPATDVGGDASGRREGLRQPSPGSDR
jgi:hypothetical protein